MKKSRVLKKSILAMALVAGSVGLLFYVGGRSMEKEMYQPLTAEEERVIVYKGTETPFSGEYNNFFEKGTYHCKRCGAPLYFSESKFQSSCGWPSFDDEIEGAVTRKRDADGRRTEILCSACGGHLGHVFEGEGLTEKNVRHCVNSVSMKFVPAANKPVLEKGYFAGGCFWGIEYYFEHKFGVTSAVSGYMGGKTENPTYDSVCSGKTGHFEAVEVTYEPQKVSYEELCRFFFEIHNPGQEDGQGPDIGEQYLSAIFYQNENERKIAQEQVALLKSKGYSVATQLRPATVFWKAEEYHQNYYDKNHRRPYCHVYQKKF